MRLVWAHRRLLTALAVVACARDAATSDTASGRAETTIARTDTPSRLRDTASRSMDTTTPLTGVAVLTRVQTARHDGYERIVFEFRDAVPRYVVEYRPTAGEACGSGDPVSVEGSAFLAIRFTPADAHVFDGERAESSIPARHLRPRFPVLRELRLNCDFEAEVGWTAGLSARRPFRVHRLESPPRVVVDLATGG